MAKYPAALDHLINFLKLLPGVGTKTAERFAFQLLTWPSETIAQFSKALATLKEQVPQCPTCFCFSNPEGCQFCDIDKRDPSLLCIIGNPKDVYAIEETHTYKGIYHVLGTLLSPLDGRTVEQLNLPALLERVQHQAVQEVIIALDSTLEGDATALYLKEKLSELGIPVYRLAFGLPLGSPLEYVDGGTLSRAFSGRQPF